VLAEALQAARGIGDEGDRSTALAALAPHLTEGLLTEALQAAKTIGDDRDRCHALAALAARLFQFHPPGCPPLWAEVLHGLGTTRRQVVLNALPDLVPLLAFLAGITAPVELQEVARAIIDTGRWWP
jgi:hypothetical protein